MLCGTDTSNNAVLCWTDTVRCYCVWYEIKRTNLKACYSCASSHFYIRASLRSLFRCSIYTEGIHFCPYSWNSLLTLQNCMIGIYTKYLLTNLILVYICYIAYLIWKNCNLWYVCCVCVVGGKVKLISISSMYIILTCTICCSLYITRNKYMYKSNYICFCSFCTCTPLLSIKRCIIFYEYKLQSAIKSKQEATIKINIDMA